MRRIDRHRRTRRRIVWLATADARHHLVRAHLVRELLAEASIDVSIFTTSAEGVSFLESLGSPSTLLKSSYSVEFDDRHNLKLKATAAKLLRYFTDPRQFFDDLSQLRTVAAHSICVVNDFHPALLVGGSLFRKQLPTVQLHGDNLWHSLVRPFRQPLGRFVNPICTGLLERLRARSTGLIIQRPLAALEANWTAPETVELPPLVPRPARTDADPDADPTIAAHLSPHFHSPELVRSIERVAEDVGATLHGLDRRTRRRNDSRWDLRAFASRTSRADLLIAAPTMLPLGLARTLDKPLLMLVPDVPEHRRNAAAMLQACRTPPCARVDLDEPRLYRTLRREASELLEASPLESGRAATRVDAVQNAWRNALSRLADRLETRRMASVA